jgi:hypothetical protein
VVPTNCVKFGLFYSMSVTRVIISVCFCGHSKLRNVHGINSGPGFFKNLNDPESNYELFHQDSETAHTACNSKAEARF